jgi:hypothetical protein
MICAKKIEFFILYYNLLTPWRHYVFVRNGSSVTSDTVKSEDFLVIKS